MAPFREFHEQQMARRVNAPISAMWLLTNLSCIHRIRELPRMATQCDNNLESKYENEIVENRLLLLSHCHLHPGCLCSRLEGSGTLGKCVEYRGS
jgi:hypothetical protein